MYFSAYEARRRRHLWDLTVDDVGQFNSPPELYYGDSSEPTGDATSTRRRHASFDLMYPVNTCVFLPQNPLLLMMHCISLPRISSFGLRVTHYFAFKKNQTPFQSLLLIKTMRWSCFPTRRCLKLPATVMRYFSLSA